MEHVFKTIVGFIGDVAAGLIICVPLFTTIKQIRQAGNVGERHSYTFVFTWLNAVALVFYAAPTAGDLNSIVVIAINSMAAVAETYYCYVFVRNSTGTKHIICWAMTGMQGLFVVIMLVLQFVVFAHNQHPQARENTFGALGAATAALMYAAPLVQVVRIVRNTHDAANLDPWLSFAYLANASIWTLFASLSPFSFYLVVGNGLGVLCTAVQCVVWLVYHNAQQ